jgi:hypothetical protein
MTSEPSVIGVIVQKSSVTSQMAIPIRVRVGIVVFRGTRQNRIEHASHTSRKI